mmetsp:Transcript_22233/g.61996  ORF Transcript_22233/g.61996 Transcript_22233/m.61996 type:complete len:377 (+) Transcript_22233:341-1471(+)
MARRAATDKQKNARKKGQRFAVRGLVALVLISAFSFACNQRLVHPFNSFTQYSESSPAGSDGISNVQGKASVPASFSIVPGLDPRGQRVSTSTRDADAGTLASASAPPTGAQLKPYCFGSFFGQHCNRIISMARLLSLRNDEGENRPIALDEAWTEWFLSVFDEREEFIYNHDSKNCHVWMESMDVFFLKNPFAPYLPTLLPKKQHREEAERILDSWPHGRNFISVHRRNLDGKCKRWASCREPICEDMCLSTSTCTLGVRLDACDMEYKKVHNPSNLTVVLFTDNQVPRLDRTFPTRFDQSSASHFLVEVLLMTKSTTHWGNPLSSGDVIVYHWRKGMNMEPEPCRSVWKHYMEPHVLIKAEGELLHVTRDDGIL